MTILDTNFNELTKTFKQKSSLTQSTSIASNFNDNDSFG